MARQVSAAVTPFTVDFIAGIEFNGRILISSSGGEIYEWEPGASSATQVHGQVATGKRTRPLIVFGGSLYAAAYHSSSATDLYAIDLVTPANTRLVGVFPSEFNRPTGGGILLAPLSTSFVEEGTNLYYTNARADARILAPARTSNTDRWAKNKLPSDIFYGTPGSGTDEVFVVATPSGRPTPTASTVADIYFVQQDDSLSIGVDDRHITTDATGTFTTIPTRTDLHIVTSTPNLGGTAVGDFYFLNYSPTTGGQEFYKVITHGVSKKLRYVTAAEALGPSRSVNTNAVVFMGAESSVTDALRFTRTEVAATNYFFLNTGLSTPAFQRMTVGTFTAAGGVADHYLWKRLPIPTDADIDARILATARTGNTDRWAKNKLPSDINYSTPFGGAYSDLTGVPTLGTAAALDTGSAAGNVPVLDSSGMLDDDELTANIPRKSLSNTFAKQIIIQPAGDEVCLFVKAENLTTQTPFVFNISASGNQQAMWLRRGSTGQAWMTVDGNAGGDNEMPGIFFGDGVATRDVVLHRREADVLKTPDTMDVGALQIAGIDLDIDVGFLSATALHFEHLDALTADIELETEKTYVRVTAIANGGLHNSSGSTEPTFTTAQTFTYAVEHTYGTLTGTASAFWKWVSIRIPETIDVGGTVYDTNFVDYRVRNRSTQSDGRDYYSLGNIEELGVAGGWRYGKIRSRIYENSVQHIEADTLQIRGTEFHGDIPDAAQIKGGTLDVDRIAWTGSQADYDALTPDGNTRST